MDRSNSSTYALSIIGAMACVIVGVKLYNDGKDGYTIVSAVGSLASLFGLAIAILQILSLKRISTATQQAIEETRTQLIQNISISDVSKAIKVAEQVQDHLGHKKYELAHFRLQDLRTLLIQFRGNSEFSKSDNRQKYDDSLADIGVHLLNLYNEVFMKEKNLNPAAINETLERIIAILISFENQLRYSRGNYGR